VKIGKGVRQECCLTPITLNLYCKYLTNKPLEGFGDCKIGQQVIRTMKCADDLTLLPKEETVLYGTIDRLTETGRSKEWK
jgi:hypothetical protein